MHKYLHNKHSILGERNRMILFSVNTPWIEKVDDDDYDVFDDYHNKVKSIPYPPCASNLIIINF